LLASGTGVYFRLRDHPFFFKLTQCSCALTIHQQSPFSGGYNCAMTDIFHYRNLPLNEYRSLL
jgi:hypothetical protein